MVFTEVDTLEFINACLRHSGGDIASHLDGLCAQVEQFVDSLDVNELHFDQARTHTAPKLLILQHPQDLVLDLAIFGGWVVRFDRIENGCLNSLGESSIFSVVDIARCLWPHQRLNSPHFVSN